MPVVHGPLYLVVSEALQLRADDALLDVACGSGVFLARQAGHVHRVAGVDLSDIQIAMARRRLGDRIAAGTAEIVVEAAGFTDVTIEYAPSSGDAPWLKLLTKLSGPAGKDLRLVRALKQ